MVISSGSGVHAYFVMDRDIPASEWDPLAVKLDALVKHINFPVDSSRTADFASILRPVGTHNKKATPLPVELIEDAGPISFDWFKNRLLNLTKGLKDVRVTKRAPATKEEIALDEGPSDPKVKALWKAEHIRTLERKANADFICNECAQMRQFRDSKGDLHYGPWFACLGVMHYCIDGERLAEEWSSKRVETGHSQVFTKQKWDAWGVDSPATCKAFSVGNNGCDGCPYKGKITTPLELGLLSHAELHPEECEVQEQTAETESPEASKTSAQIAVEYATSVGEKPLLLPTGFSWVEGLGMTMDANGDKEPIVFAGTYFHIVRRYIEDEVEQYTWRLFDPNTHAHKEFSFNGGLTSSLQNLKKALGDQGIQTLDKGDYAMLSYVKGSIERIRRETAAMKVASNFGWQSDGSIVVGTRKFTPNTPMGVAKLDAKIRAKVSLFSKPVGTVEGYSNAINAIYNRKGMEPLQYAMCSLWGSLLVELIRTKYNGIPCALTGSKSGIGKTTAAQAALFAFSNSDDLTIPGFDAATPGVRGGRLSMLHNFPVLFDEMTMRGQRGLASEKLSEFAYVVAHGSEKARMVQINGVWVPGDTATWKSQSVITGNTNWLDVLSQGNANFDPESMRIFEINTDDYPNIPSLKPKRWVDEQVAQIKENSGKAGEVYCQFLVDNRDKIKTLLHNFYSTHTCPTEFDDAKFRFYRSHVACTITAAEIMKKLGVIQFDLHALYEFALSAATALIQRSNLKNMDTLEKLRTFLTDMAPWTIVTEHYYQGVSGPSELRPRDNLIKVRRIYCSPKVAKDSAKHRYSHLDNTIMVYKNYLKEWLSEKSEGSLKDLLAKLDKMGVIKHVKDDRFSLGKGTPYIGDQGHCVVFDLKKISPDDFEEETQNE